MQPASRGFMMPFDLRLRRGDMVALNDKNGVLIVRRNGKFMESYNRS